MNSTVAVKLAEHLGSVAAHARVQRAVNAHMQKRADGASDFLYGGLGGAALGALAGGGTTAALNLFREKRDRRSILHNALLGGLGGGALGLAGTSIMKGLAPAKDGDPPLTDAEVAKIQAAIEANDAQNKTRKDMVLMSPETKMLASLGLGGAGFAGGTYLDRKAMLNAAYLNPDNKDFRKYVNEKVLQLPAGNARNIDSKFTQQVAGAASVPGAYKPVNVPEQFTPLTPKQIAENALGANPPHKPVPVSSGQTPNTIRKQVRTGLAFNRAPVIRRGGGTLAGLLAPWLIEPLIYYGTGAAAEDNRYDSMTRLQAELAAARRSK